MILYYNVVCAILWLFFLSFNNKQKYTPHPNVAHEESLNRCRKLRVFVLYASQTTLTPIFCPLRQLSFPNQPYVLPRSPKAFPPAVHWSRDSPSWHLPTGMAAVLYASLFTCNLAPEKKPPM